MNRDLALELGKMCVGLGFKEISGWDLGVFKKYVKDNKVVLMNWEEGDDEVKVSCIHGNVEVRDEIDGLSEICNWLYNDYEMTIEFLEGELESSRECLKDCVRERGWIKSVGEEVEYARCVEKVLERLREY